MSLNELLTEIEYNPFSKDPLTIEQIQKIAEKHLQLLQKRGYESKEAEAYRGFIERKIQDPLKPLGVEKSSDPEDEQANIASKYIHLMNIYGKNSREANKYRELTLLFFPS